MINFYFLRIPEISILIGFSFITKFKISRSVHARYRDDYEEKEVAAPSASATSNAEGLVKPAAPSSSVYARPRTPPKIRRPVPLSEQDRYAYKTTPAQPTGKIRL